MITNKRPSDLRRVASLIGVSILIPRSQRMPARQASSPRMGSRVGCTSIPRPWPSSRSSALPRTSPLAGILRSHPASRSRRRSYLPAPPLARSSGRSPRRCPAVSQRSSSPWPRSTPQRCSGTRHRRCSRTRRGARRRRSSERTPNDREEQRAGLVAGPSVASSRPVRSDGRGAGALLMLMLSVPPLYFSEAARTRQRRLDRIFWSSCATLSSSTLWSAAGYSFLFGVTPGSMTPSTTISRTGSTRLINDRCPQGHQPRRRCPGRSLLQPLPKADEHAHAPLCRSRSLQHKPPFLSSDTAFHPAAFVAVEAANG